MADMTAGVESLLGSPGKALRSIMWPILISLLVTQFVTLADSIWCAGLGVDALTAVSYMSPVYWMLAGIGTGMGIGVATLVARCIGENDRGEASSYLCQSLVFMTVLSLVLVIPLYLVMPSVMSFMGGDSIMDDCLAYAYPLTVLCPLVILNGVIMGGLRGEGDGRMILLMNVVTGGVNIIVDPVLIYVLGLGLTGAALSTAVAAAISLGLGIIWYRRGRTYVPLSFKGFRISRAKLRTLLAVGGPQIVEYDVMYMFNIVLFYYVSAVGGTTGVAVYNTPWRLIHIAVAPAEAFGSAVVPVASAALGQRMPDKAVTVYRYATVQAIIVGVAVAIFLALFAEYGVWLFTYGGDTVQYRAEMADVLRIYCTFLPFFGLCFVGAGVVQSMKKGYVSLGSALVRNFILVGTYMWASTVSMTAIYWCTSASEIIGGVLAMVLAYVYIRKLRNGVVS